MFSEETQGIVREAGFDLIEEVALDLGSLKQERNVIPPSKDVRLQIKSASVSSNKANTFRQIKLDLVVVDGIQVGEEIKYKGSHIFQNVCYYADPNVYTKDYFTKRQHLIPLKQLCGALGVDLSAVRINDGFLVSLNGQIIRGTIKIANNTWTNKEGVLVEDIKNEVVGFKKSEPVI